MLHGSKVENIRIGSPSGTVVVPYSLLHQFRTLKHELSLFGKMLLLHPIDALRLRRRITRFSGPILLSLGSGRVVDSGWVGLDLCAGKSVFRSDLRTRLPLSQRSVDAILAEHVLEHLFLHEIPHLLQECHRALKPGGTIRIVCPDALLLAQILTDGDSNERVKNQLAFEIDLHALTSDDLLPLHSVNRLSHQWGEHRSLLTPDGIATLLDRAGFEQIKVLQAVESHHFSQVPGTHLRTYPGSEHESFAVEAIR